MYLTLSCVIEFLVITRVIHNPTVLPVHCTRTATIQIQRIVAAKRFHDESKFMQCYSGAFFVSPIDNH